MKYKLINRETGEETLCNKITIDGFDYYVSDEKATEGFYGYINFQGGNIKKVGKYFADDWKKVIATNNPDIGCPKVVDEVDEVEKFAEKYSTRFQLYGGKTDELLKEASILSFLKGYNKSQETHPFSEEDMIEFGKFCRNLSKHNKDILRKNPEITELELLQIWKEQRIKTLYYE